MPPRDPLNLTGQIIAEKYQVEHLVGEGGFAVVYRAIHTIWNQPVAIKFFNGLSSAPVELRDSLQREFIQEGALLTELSSQTAGIVQARDVGAITTPNGQWMPYMVLEWLEGSPLENVLLHDRRHGLLWTVDETVGFLARVLPALDVAHARGIAHRDIKPANLFVLGSAARSPQTPIKLLDFGVAKMVSDHAQFNAASAKTGVAITSFTPKYGAPEQFTRSYGATGPWTDVYAVALVAVEMLTGKDALDGGDLVQLGFSSTNTAERPTPRALGRDISDALEAVFVRALAVSPGERYANAGEFLRAALAAVESRSSAAELARPPSSSDIALPAPASSGLEPTAMAPLEPIAKTPSLGAATVQSPSEARSRPARGGKFATFLAFVVVLVSVVALFSVSEMRGAKETREALREVADSIRGLSDGQRVPETESAEPASSTAESTTVALSCPDGMVLIPAARVTLGAEDPSSPKQEQPAHLVSLSAYCIDLNEVTAVEYEACTKAGDCQSLRSRVSWPSITARQQRAYASLCTFGRENRADYPINCLNWEMAHTYCQAQGKRLPTEAEWEYAARGPAPRRYPWGDGDPTGQYLNACGANCQAWGKQHGLALSPLPDANDDHSTLAPIGLYEQGRSHFGLFNMAGNVSEWVADWYGDYPADAQEDPQGPERGKHRVVRGGAWDSSGPASFRTTFRRSENPNVLHHAIGFRCASTPSSPAKLPDPASPPSATVTPDTAASVGP